MCLSCHDGVIGFDALNGLIRTEAQGVQLAYPGAHQLLRKTFAKVTRLASTYRVEMEIIAA